MAERQHSIEFIDALKKLKAFTFAIAPEIVENPEFLAMATHWLTSGEQTAPLVSDELSDKWKRYLTASLEMEDFVANPLNFSSIVNSGSKFTLEYNDTTDGNVNYKQFPFPPLGATKFKFIDLFAGIGGFCLALKEHGGSCVFASEWDKAAKRTYFQNHAKFPYGDIRQFTSLDIDDSEIDENIPNHDVLAAGFPCQPFSRAGVSARNYLNQKHGFACEVQGTLFFDIVRLANVKRPKYLLLENVGNLIRHDEGRTLATIRSVIEEDLGYSFSYSVIDAQTYVPQRRKRCYMICVRDHEFQFEFPEYFFEGEPKKLRSILEDAPDPSYTISKKLWDGHIERTKRNLARGTGFTATIADLEKPSNTLVARYGKDGKECLIGQTGGPPRMLTIREAARLQGYPERFIPASTKTQAYKQFGNSVAVPVVTALARELVSRL